MGKNLIQADSGIAGTMINYFMGQKKSRTVRDSEIFCPDFQPRHFTSKRQTRSPEHQQSTSLTRNSFPVCSARIP